MPLEEYYSGDDAFHHFVVACAPVWAGCACRQELLRECGSDLDLAMALYYHFADGALGWLDQVVAALGHLTPRQCLLTESGLRRLKECLLRMP